MQLIVVVYSVILILFSVSLNGGQAAVNIRGNCIDILSFGVSVLLCS